MFELFILILVTGFVSTSSYDAGYHDGVIDASRSYNPCMQILEDYKDSENDRKEVGR